MDTHSAQQAKNARGKVCLAWHTRKLTPGALVQFREVQHTDAFKVFCRAVRTQMLFTLIEAVHLHVLRSLR